jgi:hypothetical protein
MTYSSNLDATTNANKFPTPGGVVTTAGTGAVSGLALPAAKLGIEKLANIVPVITNAGALTAPSQASSGTNGTHISAVALTGVTASNSDALKLYWTITGETDAFVVHFFTDAAHTAANEVATSAAAAASATGVVISEANDSGIAGTCTFGAGIAAVTAADNKVTVVYGTGYTFAVKGTLLVDTTNGILYINTGTDAVPAWTKVGTQS